MIHVFIDCDDPSTHLRPLLGPERPDVSSGYGGWEEIERPKRSTVTTWRGQPARRMSINVLFDNWTDVDPAKTEPAGASIEGDIRALERLALPRSGGQPPTVKVSAAGGVIPPAYERLDWVVDAITWGDALANEHWNRVRQEATIVFLEYVSDALVKLSPAKKRRDNKNRKSGKNSKKGASKKRAASKAGRKGGKKKVGLLDTTTVAFDGEDLLSVAARELGDATRWHEIAELNGIRDPRAITRAQIIRLP